MASSRIVEDPRIDPRIKVVFGSVEVLTLGDVDSREEILEEVSSEKAVAARKLIAEFGKMFDTEDIAPSQRLTVTEHQVVSEPDGNRINIRLIRPDNYGVLPLRVLHPRRWDGVAVVLPRKLPGVGQDHRGPGSSRGHGRLPQPRGGFVGARGGPVPRRVERLRIGCQVGGRQPRRVGR
jgi:hypothetical protein